MNKVLIITYYWPPSGGAGVQRWLKFVKYMRQFGWEPVIYTAENPEMPVRDDSLLAEIPEGVQVIKTPIWEPYTIYKRLIGRKKDDRINAAFLNEGRKTGFAEKLSVWIRGNFFIPDARKFWIKPSVRYLTDYLRRNNIQCVVSSGPPHSMHLIAAGLKKNLPGLKWLADFRDPWTNIDFYSELMLSRFADRKHHRLELQVLKQADVVLSVGSTMRAEFERMYQASGGTTTRFKVIPNGYDPDDVPRVAVPRDAKFSLAHIGTLVKDRNPEVLWRVLADLIKTQPGFAARLEIKLVGKVDVFVLERIKAHGLETYLRKIDYLPHKEVTVEQQRSHVLLLLVNNTKNAKGILTGKFFEYMASGTPVLTIGPQDGDLAGIIRETGCGLISGFEDERQLRQNICALFDGSVMERNPTAVASYSRRQLTAQLCNVLTDMCAVGNAQA